MASTSAAVPAEPVVVEKSELDPRSFRYVCLGNGLRALLVSDPLSERSAAALDVHVGHFADPAEIPGLAHFLEHMLFLGTAKYPDENSYSAYLAAHGGSSNAYTAHEDTCFFFDVENSAFDEALDRFAQFFIAPLFAEGSTEREMNAVESEHAKNAQQDPWRQQQLLRSMARPDHPLSRFGTGSLQTLSVPNIRPALLDFHARHYAASRMTLVVLSTASLDELEQSVTAKFDAVRRDAPMAPPEAALAPVATALLSQPFARPLQQVVQMVPVRDLRTLDLYFPLPYSRQRHAASLPTHYLGHLLGHEGPGSLLSLLKRHGWATELVAGDQMESDHFSLFSVHVGLTDDGLESFPDVVAAIFAYIAMLKASGGVQQWIFDETRQLAQMHFRFRDRGDPIAFCQSVAPAMHHLPPHRTLTGRSIAERWDEAVVREMLAAMTTDNFLLLVVAREFDETATAAERWYGTKYASGAAPAELLQLWPSAAAAAGLALPQRNPFIPTDFSLRPPPPSTATAAAAPALPQLIVQTPLCHLYHLQDTHFGKPKYAVYAMLESTLSYASPRAAMLQRLMARVVEESLNEWAYDAQLCGLEYGLLPTLSGVQLHVSGYSDRVPVLLQRVVGALLDLQNDTDERRFLALRDKAHRELANFAMEQPHSHAAYDASLVLESARWHNSQYADCIRELTLPQVRDFARDLVARGFVRAVVHGNITAAEAAALIDSALLQRLGTRPLYAGEFVDLRVVQLEPGVCYRYRRAASNPANNNSAVEVDLQLPLLDIRQRALFELLHSMLAEPVFNELRTKRQLGYIVGSAVRRSHGSALALRVVVQSSTHGPLALDAAIEEFLGSIAPALLADMPAAKFASYRAALITAKLERDKTMALETQRYWREITSSCYVFDRAAREAAELHSVTQQEVVDFYARYFAPAAPLRRKLCCEIYGAGAPLPAAGMSDFVPGAPPVATLVSAAANLPLDATPGQDVFIRDPYVFKRLMPLFPAAPGTRM